MEPQKIGEMILKIRKENHLTQQGAVIYVRNIT